MNDEISHLLNGWEEVYKKGQLTFWVLLAVRDQPRHMKDIKAFISQATKETFAIDNNSMYRALKRYKKAGLLHYTLAPGQGGPERKMFQLTNLGARLLKEFSKRNIIGVFYDPSVKKLIESGE